MKIPVKQETRLQKSLTILYGSQTGNGQAIAEALHDEAIQRGLKSWVRPLNEWKQVIHMEIARGLGLGLVVLDGM